LFSPSPPAVNDLPIDYPSWLRLPYSTGVQNKQQGFNCWGLMQAFLKEACGLDVHSIDVDFNDKRRVELEAHRQLNSGHWQAIEHPTAFCVVQMSHAVVPHHVGVYVPVNGGSILHTTQGTSSLLQKRHQVSLLGFHITGYYTFLG